MKKNLQGKGKTELDFLFYKTRRGKGNATKRPVEKRKTKREA